MRTGFGGRLHSCRMETASILNFSEKTHSSEPRHCHCSSMLQMLQIRQKPAAEDDRLSIKPKLYPFSGSILGVM